MAILAVDGTSVAFAEPTLDRRVFWTGNGPFSATGCSEPSYDVSSPFSSSGAAHDGTEFEAAPKEGREPAPIGSYGISGSYAGSRDPETYRVESWSLDSSFSGQLPEGSVSGKITDYWPGPNNPEDPNVGRPSFSCGYEYAAFNTGCYAAYEATIQTPNGPVHETGYVTVDLRWNSTNGEETFYAEFHRESGGGAQVGCDGGGGAPPPPPADGDGGGDGPPGAGGGGCDVGGPGLALDFIGAVARGSRLVPGAGAIMGLVDLACSFTGPDDSNRAAKFACRGLGVASVGLGIAAIATSWTLVGGAVGAVASIGTGVAGAFACAHDPPDPNFTTIARPNVQKFQLDAEGRRAPRPVREALVAFGQNAFRIAATADASLRCQDRAAGAKNAGDGSWEARQRACASKYAAQVAKLLAGDKELRKRLGRTVRRAGIKAPRVTTETIRGASASIRRRMRRTLRRKGWTTAQIEFIDRRAAKGLRSIEVPRDVFDWVDGPAVMRALDRGARGFRQISAQYK